MDIIDRTQYTSSIAQSRQRSWETGRFLPIFASRGRSRTRDVRRIDSIVLHATGFSRLDTPGTDSTGSENDDFDHTIAHFVVRQNGDVIRLRTYDVYLNNALALYSVSIEVEGNFASAREIRGDQWQSRRHSMPLAQIFAGRALVQHIRNELNNIHYIFGHAQLTTLGSKRANCPGPHVWYNIGEWAVSTLGMHSSGHSARVISPDWQNPALDLVWPVGFTPNALDDAQYRDMIRNLSDGMY
jgi:hypothetical protein